MPKMKCVVPKKKYLKEVSKVINLLANYEKDDADLAMYRRHIDYSANKKLNTGRSFSSVAKKCVATHRYIAATMMLNVVAQELNMVHLFFFKAASIILENTPTTTSEEFFSFIRLVRCLGHLSKPEIMLEYLMFVLRRNDFDGAHNLKVLISEQRKLQVQNAIIDPLLKIYMGLFDYIEWSRITQNNDDDPNAQLIAEKTIECFKEVTKTPGEFDVFVLKLVEMLEFANRVEDVEDVLTKYATLNPEHLNSHIYLFTFLEKHNPTSPQLFNTLKTIVKRSPSDPRVLIFAEMYLNKNPRKSLKYLFLFLDYPLNSSNCKAWEMMYDALVKLLTKQLNSTKTFIATSWKDRSDYWPYLHFDTDKINYTRADEAMLLVHKASVLHSLEKRPHPYVQTVFSKLADFPDNYKVELKKNLIKLDELNNAAASYRELFNSDNES